jgi:hypothetical protein
MITMQTETARQSDRRKQKLIRGCGKDNAQPCISESMSVHLNSCLHIHIGVHVLVHVPNRGMLICKH